MFSHDVFRFVLGLFFLVHAGFPYEVLANGHFVPGGDRCEMSRYRGKPIWKEILEVTTEVCDVYFQRVDSMFNSAVTSDFSNKMKALKGRVGCNQYHHMQLGY